MIIGIDGTGPADAAEYTRTMRSSFVNQLIRDYSGRGAMYFRGPGNGWPTHQHLPGAQLLDLLAGTSTAERAREAMIAARVAIRADDEVVLTGYSRGGAVAIQVANLIRLEFPNFTIRALALFDAVDRSELSAVDRIPGNVARAFHAIRDPITASRTYFGNCGLVAEASCDLTKLTFVTTHGGMGGVPFPDSIEEAFSVKIGPNTEMRQSDLVKSWMWANLRNLGVAR